MPREPEENTKGGGQRGGPRRWTGTGPRPARHIPWPELFKHHQSNLTGHLKMMDMVRKHCVPGTGNYEAAQACVDRTHEMLRMFKEATRNFVPPRDNIDRVPLGASSASMYPGYSPADHVYGEAAAEYGATVAEARRQGKEIKSDSNGIEYVVGQSKLSARDQLAEVEKSIAAKRSKQSGEMGTEAGRNQENGEPMEGVEQTTDASQFFMVDSNPTPVSVLQNRSDGLSSKGKNKANDKAKRRMSSHEDQSSATADAPEDSHKTKKVKAVMTEEPTIKPKPLVEEDDISAEVDRRLAEKEERRRQKAEKKRKRDSGSSHIEATGVVGITSDEALVEKPEKKKHKKDKGPEDVKDAEPAAGEAKKQKKEKKKRASGNGEQDVETDGAVESEKAEKKKKKRKKDLGEANV